MLKIKLFVALVLFFMIFLFMNEQLLYATGWDVKTYPTNGCVTYRQTVSFTNLGDTLKFVVLEPIPVAGYDSAVISVKTSGTTPNFRIHSYLTNFPDEETDSTYWTLKQQWDTVVATGLGKCALKPVNKILYTATSTGPMGWNIITVKGLSGNTLNTSVDIAITYYRFIKIGSILKYPNENYCDLKKFGSFPLRI